MITKLRYWGRRALLGRKDTDVRLTVASPLSQSHFSADSAWFASGIPEGQVGAGDSPSRLVQPKVFCIGFNKTGTTSLESALTTLGYRFAPQQTFEVLLDDWLQRRFGRLIELCRHADAFQDVPFSLPFTYQALDLAFPGSKFVLTVRSDSEQWYQSITRFHAKLFGDGNVLSSAELRAASYCYPGWLEKLVRGTYHTPEEDPYNRNLLIAAYERHNQSVIEYFAHRPMDLLILNVSEEGAMQKLAKFVGKPDPGRSFPWLNRTAES